MENTVRDFILLANDTVLENARCGYSDRSLWCWIPDKKMVDMFELFSDPENLKTIQCKFLTTRTLYKGFTELLAIQKVEDNLGKYRIEVRLTWPEGGEHEIIPLEENTEPEEEI